VPTAVAFGSLDLADPGGIHLAERDQPDRLFAIDLRPDALLGSRHEALQPVTLVAAFLLAVNPSEAKGRLYGLEVRYRPRVGTLLGDSEPHAGGRGVVVTQPGKPRFL